MSPADVDAYFKEIPVWMQADINREIQLAMLSGNPATALQLAGLGLAGGGNLLAALGLVSYTETLGLIRRWNRRKGVYPKTEECFLAFFDEMHAPAYRDWRRDWESRHRETTLYETLRCGLVHEYTPKVDSAVYISPGDPLGLDEENAVLIFKVEPYFRHFGEEIKRLYTELSGMVDPEIPPPKIKKSQTAIPNRSPSPPTGNPSVRRSS